MTYDNDNIIYYTISIDIARRVLRCKGQSFSPDGRKRPAEKNVAVTGIRTGDRLIRSATASHDDNIYCDVTHDFRIYQTTNRVCVMIYTEPWYKILYFRTSWILKCFFNTRTQRELGTVIKLVSKNITGRRHTKSYTTN